MNRYRALDVGNLTECGIYTLMYTYMTVYRKIGHNVVHLMVVYMDLLLKNVSKIEMVRSAMDEVTVLKLGANECISIKNIYI